MSQGVTVRDVSKVIDILTSQNADLTKNNAILSVIIQEKNEEIIELRKLLEETDSSEKQS